MARIGAPHGVRGEVRLSVFTEDPLALRRYNPFTTPSGSTVKLTRIKQSGKAIVGAIEGVEDRDAANALNGTELSIPRARLPRPEEDEFYHVDLIGLSAVHVDGAALGTVRAIVDYGAGDLMEIAGETSLLVPFTRAAVPTVDVERGVVFVDPPPGLLDDGEPSQESGEGPDAGPPAR